MRFAIACLCTQEQEAGEAICLSFLLLVVAVAVAVVVVVVLVVAGGGVRVSGVLSGARKSGGSSTVRRGHRAYSRRGTIGFD